MVRLAAYGLTPRSGRSRSRDVRGKPSESDSFNATLRHLVSSDLKTVETEILRPAKKSAGPQDDIAGVGHGTMLYGG
jgi:hypothetical protein